MARIVKKSNSVKTKYTFYLAGRILSYSGTIICILLAVLFTNFWFAIPGVVFGALSGYFTLTTIKIKFAANLLSTLPENYHVFHNVKITTGGEEAKLDVVVVSQNRVSIIKVNNENGEITGNINDDYWRQITTNEDNYTYSTNIDSPIRQLESHGDTFNQYLKTHGVSVIIDRCVYFSDEDTFVNIRNRHYSDIPIFSCKEIDKLIGYLLDSKNQNIMGKELTKIVELLR
jgi:hypothetical protein